MLVPSLSAMDAQINQAHKAIDECKTDHRNQRARADANQGDEEVAKYLALAASIQQGAVKLNAAQQDKLAKDDGQVCQVQ